MSTPLPSSDSIEVIAADGSRRVICGDFQAYDSRRLILTTDEPLLLDVAVSVQHEDVLFLGEVLSCGPAADSFRITVRVKHMLTSLQSLARLREQLLDSHREATKAAASVSQVLQSDTRIRSVA